jgi:RNA polymerase sigma factor (sigma-70 family)
MLVGVGNPAMLKHDPHQFGALIEPYLDDLFRAAYRLSGNKPDAEDLVQETCVRAYPKLKTLVQSGKPKSWLMRVQYNLFVDATRRKQRSPFQSLTDLGESTKEMACKEPGPGELAHEKQLEDQFQQAWLMLNRKQRALLALRAEGYNLAELGDMTGLERDVLNARLYRARKSLARHLRKGETPVVPLPRLEGQK